MSKATIKAKCNVHDVGHPGVIAIENELSFDEGRKTITVGRKKMKLSDLQKAPSDSNGKVSLVSSRLRVVTPSTPESRSLMASVTAIWRKGGGGGGGGVNSYVDRLCSGGGNALSRQAILVDAHSSGGSRKNVSNGSGSISSSGSIGSLNNNRTATALSSRAQEPLSSCSRQDGKKRRPSLLSSLSTSTSSPHFPLSSSSSALKKAKGFRPFNTLNLVSRGAPPPARTGSKRSQKMISYAATVAYRSLPSLVAKDLLNAVSSGGTMLTSPPSSSGTFSRGEGGGDYTDDAGDRPSSIRNVRGYRDSRTVRRNGNAQKESRRGKRWGGGEGGGHGDDEPLEVTALRSAAMGHGWKGSDDEELSEAEGPACNSTPPPPLSRHSDRRGTDYSSSNSINPKSKVRGFNRTDGTEAEWWSSSPAIIPAIKKKLTPRFSSGDYRRFPSPPILSTRTYSACGQGAMSRYMVHREPLARREGFRNLGNTCYINACLQGLLSLGGFMSDLERQCWVLSMLMPPVTSEDSGAVSTSKESANSAATNLPDACACETSAVARTDRAGLRDGEGELSGVVAAARAEATPSLYDALLRLSLEARGSHGLMDATPLKRAMDRHSDRFAGNLQQDAHEFLSDLINVLHDEMQPRLDAATMALSLESLSRETNPTFPERSQEGSIKTVKGNNNRDEEDEVVVDLSEETDQGENAAHHGGSFDVVELTTGRDEGGRSSCAAPDGVRGRGDGDSEIVEIIGVGGGGGGLYHLHRSPCSPRKPRISGRRGPSEAAAPPGGRCENGQREVVDVDGASPLPSSESAAVRLQGGEFEVSQTEEGRMREGERKHGGSDKSASSEDTEDRALGERLMPTTRHFHAEVEVTLTCTRCAYSRQRRELYRDFSLDVPYRDQHPGEGGQDGASGLNSLLDGFFRPTELKLRCERCDHDRVLAEHTLADLPGALILHIKRFKPVVSVSPCSSASAARVTATDTSGETPASAPPPQPSSSPSTTLPFSAAPPPAPPALPAAARLLSASAAVVVTPKPSDLLLVPSTTSTATGESTAEEKDRLSAQGSVSAEERTPRAVGETADDSAETGSSGVRGKENHEGCVPSYGVSYVKMTAPVSVPLELDLERFCTGFTGNAPADDLGQRVGSLESLGIPQDSPEPRRRPTATVSPPTLSGKSVAGAHATNKAGSRTGLRAGFAEDSGGSTSTSSKEENIKKKRLLSNGISVDLSQQEGWSSSAGGGGTGSGGGGVCGAESGGGGGKKRTRDGSGGYGTPLEAGGKDSSGPFRFPSPLRAVEGGRGKGGVIAKGGDIGRSSPPSQWAGGVSSRSFGVLSDSTNRGYLETASERRRRSQKEKEKSAAASVSKNRDRWAGQSSSSSSCSSSRSNDSSISSNSRFAEDENKMVDAGEDLHRRGNSGNGGGGGGGSRSTSSPTTTINNPYSSLSRKIATVGGGGQGRGGGDRRAAVSSPLAPEEVDGCLDEDGNINYLRLLSKNKRREERHRLSPLEGVRGLASALGGGRGSLGTSSSSSSLSRFAGGESGRERYSSQSTNNSARLDDTYQGDIGAALERKKLKRLERDAEEQEQLEAALAASRKDSIGYDTGADEESQLARAIRLSQQETMIEFPPPQKTMKEFSKEALGGGESEGGGRTEGNEISCDGMYGEEGINGGDGGLWECSVCTFHNSGKAFTPMCEVCGTPKSKLALELNIEHGPSSTTAACPRLPERSGSNNREMDGDGGRKDKTALATGREFVNRSQVSRLGGFSAEGGEGVLNGRCPLITVSSKVAWNGHQDEVIPSVKKCILPSLSSSPSSLLPLSSANVKKIEPLQTNQQVQKQEDEKEDNAETADEPLLPPRIARKAPLRARYELRGVLHHLGRHAFAGHYVTDVRERAQRPTPSSSSTLQQQQQQLKDKNTVEDTQQGGVGSGRGGVLVGDRGRGESTAGVGEEGGRGVEGEAGEGKGRGSGGWKRHDDSVVLPVSEATALDGAARRTCYICFYSLVE